MVKTMVAKTSAVSSMVMAVVMASYAMSSHLVGWFVGQLGISQATAFVIVSLIASGGLDTLALLYPFALPFVATAQFLIGVIGFAAVVGW